MRAFTLIETIVTIAVFILALGAVAGFLLLGYRTQTYAFQQSQAIAETRRGVEQMAKELREATMGEDGSYILERVDDYELIFYSDIDKDQEVERIRYVINPAGGESGSATQFCTSFTKGGSCSVIFSDFLTGTLDSATIQISVEGDLNGGSETVVVSADGVPQGTLCTGGDCGQCVGSYGDLTSFDVTIQAADNTLELITGGSSAVDPICDWEEPNHSLKARIQFSWQEQASIETTAVFQKIVTNPTGWPPTYTGEQETFMISENARNEARERPVFTYYDKDNNLLLDPASRLNDTTRIHLELIVNVNPERAPNDFSVETDVQLRNLKQNL